MKIVKVIGESLDSLFNLPTFSELEDQIQKLDGQISRMDAYIKFTQRQTKIKKILSKLNDFNKQEKSISKME